MRGPKVDLKLTVLPSYLGVTVLGRPPLLEETPGAIAIVGVGGVRRRIRCDSSRRGGRRLTGPTRSRKSIIEDKPTDALIDDSCYGREHSVLPHLVESLANQDLLLWEIFCRALATVIISCHWVLV